jgi:hypothetical protein
MHLVKSTEIEWYCQNRRVLFVQLIILGRIDLVIIIYRLIYIIFIIYMHYMHAQIVPALASCIDLYFSSLCLCARAKVHQYCTQRTHE